MPSDNIQQELEEILVDCYDEEEERAAWEVTFQDRIQTPFAASLLGMPVEVQEFRLGPTNSMQCLILSGKQQRWIGIEDLDEEGLPPDFQHVLDLYETWHSGDY